MVFCYHRQNILLNWKTGTDLPLSVSFNKPKVKWDFTRETQKRISPSVEHSFCWQKRCRQSPNAASRLSTFWSFCQMWLSSGQWDREGNDVYIPFADSVATPPIHHAHFSLPSSGMWRTSSWEMTVTQRKRSRSLPQGTHTRRNIYYVTSPRFWGCSYRTLGRNGLQVEGKHYGGRVYTKWSNGVQGENIIIST